MSRHEHDTEGPRRGRSLRLVHELPSILLIVACWLLQWGRVALTDHTFYRRDYFFLFEPLLLCVGRLIGEGLFPAWNPWLANGAPLAADPNAGVFFPDSLLLAAIGDGPSAVKWLVLTRLLLLPLAAYAALRIAGLARTSSCGGALIAALAGPVTSSLSSFPTHLGGAIVFLPLAVAGWCLADGRRAAVPVAAVLLALAIVAGSPEMAAQGVLVFIACGARRPWRRTSRRIVASGLLAAAIASPLLLPAARLYSRTPRAVATPSNTPPGFLSVHPSRLLELAWPGLAGDPMADHASAWWGADLNDPGVPIWYSISSGLVATLLIIVAARSALGRRLLLTLALLILIGLGRYLPFWDALGALPVLGHWRYPEKWLLGGPLLIAGAAAVALDRMRAGAPGELTALRNVAAVLAAMSLFLTTASWAAPGTVVAALRSIDVVAMTTSDTLTSTIAARTATVALRATLVAVAVAALVAASRRRVAIARLAPAALVAIAVVERLTVTLATPPIVPADAFGRPSPSVQRAVIASGDGRFFYDGEATNALDLLRPFTGTKFGLAYAGNTDLDYFSDARSRRFAEALQTLRFDDPRKASLLALANVTALATGDPTAADEPQLTSAGPAATTRELYRVHGARAARLYHRVEPVDDAHDALRYTLARGLPIESVVVAEGVDRIAHEATADDTVIITWPRPDSFRAEVVASSPALLFVASTWDPNWRVEVDGVAATTVPAASAFLGVPVGAGRHVVTGRYREPAFAVGGALSLLTLAALGWWLARPLTRY